MQRRKQAYAPEKVKYIILEQGLPHKEQTVQGNSLSRQYEIIFEIPHVLIKGDGVRFIAPASQRFRQQLHLPANFITANQYPGL